MLRIEWPLAELKFVAVVSNWRWSMHCQDGCKANRHLTKQQVQVQTCSCTCQVPHRRVPVPVMLWYALIMAVLVVLDQLLLHEGYMPPRPCVQEADFLQHCNTKPSRKQAAAVPLESKEVIRSHHTSLWRRCITISNARPRCVERIIELDARRIRRSA
jgi:hypothetical protein